MIFKPAIAFPCPFCGLRVTAGTAGEDQVCATHVMPPCPGFIDIDLVDLMVLVRTKLSNPASDTDLPS